MPLAVAVGVFRWMHNLLVGVSEGAPYVAANRICTPAPPGVQLMMAVLVGSALIVELPVTLQDSKSPLMRGITPPLTLAAGAGAGAGDVAGASNG